MQSTQLENITVDDIFLQAWKNHDIKASVLRLDKIHPVISGNKWFKLRYYLDDAVSNNKSTIITFGGAWSNHIVATAAACKMKNLRSIGIIRGKAEKYLSATLSQAAGYGMELVFIDRDKYSEKELPENIKDSNSYIIHEGGWGKMGSKGAATILDLVEKEEYSHICCAVGTATMMAGLITAAPSKATTIGINVLKNKPEAEENILSLIDSPEKKYLLIDDFHFGGYAKKTAELIAFMNHLYAETGVPSDFVYTGKLFFAIDNMIKQGFFPGNSDLLIIHSGGLQGNISLSKGTLIF